MTHAPQPSQRNRPEDAHGAIDLAVEIGKLTDWPRRHEIRSDGALRLESAKGRTLTLLPPSPCDVVPLWHGSASDLPETAIIADPGQLAAMDAGLQLGGEATRTLVMSPATLGTGPVDSVAFGDLRRCRSTSGVCWTQETLAVPQGRSWLTRVDVDVASPSTDRPRSTSRVWRPPAWWTVRNTAAITELLDRSGPVPGSPWTVMLGEPAGVPEKAARSEWVMTSWMSVTASLLDAAVRLARPELEPEDARRAVDSTFHALGFGP